MLSFPERSYSFKKDKMFWFILLIGINISLVILILSLIIPGQWDLVLFFANK